jgi:mannose-6-phosphate isomerase-like protein (cupin superfamily)
MIGYHENLKEIVLENTNFRTVLYTARHLQLVAMSLKPGEEIGKETHQLIDQFFSIEKGTGISSINGSIKLLKTGDSLLIPAGTLHNIINNSLTETLKLYTLYAPPNHADKVVRTTKQEAAEIPEKFDGKISE